MSSIQFTIPRRAADAVDFLELRQIGNAAKLPRTTIECSTISVPIGQARITTSIPMAILLTEQLTLIARAASERGRSELALACAEGAVSAFAAIDDENVRPKDESPASHTKPAPN
jgi:hypothetical protein